MVTGGFWKSFISLLAGPVRQVGVVDSVDGGGLYTVVLSDGGYVQVLGATFTVGQHVFVRDGKIEGLAATLTDVTIEI